MRRVLLASLVIALAMAGCSSGGGNDTGSRGETVSGQIRVVSQNILHGNACPADSHGCDLPDRVALFARQLRDARCPDLVSLQEANQEIVDLLRPHLRSGCLRRYHLVWDRDEGLDREVALTTGRVIGSRRDRLAGPLRTTLLVRVATDVGVVDFFGTHLASSSDDRPCDAATCPAPCQAADTLNTCQARELLQTAKGLQPQARLTVIVGDLNAKPNEPTVAAFRAAGYDDTHLAVGNAECDPATGEQCTSGRVDTSLADLTNPASIETERIDYVWMGPQGGCRAVAPTGLFNADPAIDGPGGLAYPSDHTAVQATIKCTSTKAQRDAATRASLPTTTTTRARSGAVSAATRRDIESAFNALFGGQVTDLDQKLSYLQDADVLRPFFLQRYESVKDVASRIRVRIDALRLTTRDRAAVTYTLLLDDQAVLDHLPGEAVRVDGRWLVSRRTYCDVSTQGESQIPEPCQTGGSG